VESRRFVVTLSLSEMVRLTSHAARFTVTTDEKEAIFQNVYTLPPLWDNLKESTDKSLGETSFRFDNDTDIKASAVVLKPIKGKLAPFYISQTAVFPKGDETLTPNVSVVLWMEVGAETGTMVSVNRSLVAEFDMSNTNALTLKWDGSKYVQA
jgi:hypothetical protein